jgi:hypothetical protein
MGRGWVHPNVGEETSTSMRNSEQDGGRGCTGMGRDVDVAVEDVVGAGAGVQE